MKYFSLTFILSVLISSSAFAQNICVDGQCFSTSLNDSSFLFREYWPINATLSQQQGSMNGKKPNRTIISLALNGSTYTQSNGNSFCEGVQLEISFEEGKLAAEPTYTVYMQYQSGLYTVNTEEGTLKINSFKLEPDQHSFRLFAELDCSMRSWNYAIDNKDAIRMKANFSNILITIPEWLVAKI